MASILQSVLGAVSSATTCTATFTSNLTAGTKILALVSEDINVTFYPTSVTDGTNSLTRIAISPMPSSTGGLSLWVMDTPAGDVGTKPTITATLSGNFGSVIGIMEVSGLAAGATAATVIDGGAAKANSGTTSPATSGTYANTSGELLIGVVADPGTSSTYTLSGFTQLFQTSPQTSAELAVGWATSTGSDSLSWAQSPAGDWAVLLFALLPAGSAPLLPYNPGSVLKTKKKQQAQRLLKSSPPVNWISVGSWISGATTIGLNNQAIGDLVLVFAENSSNTVWATGISGGGCTWQTLVLGDTGSASGTHSMTVFAGTVTATGSATATITYNGTVGTNHTVAHEYTSPTGTWSLDKSGFLDVASGSAFSSLTPTAAGELYAGYGVNSGGASAGSTSGYVYNANADGSGNGALHNTNCTSATQAPTWSDSGEVFNVAVLMSSSAAMSAVPLVGGSTRHHGHERSVLLYSTRRRIQLAPPVAVVQQAAILPVSVRSHAQPPPTRPIRRSGTFNQVVPPSPPRCKSQPVINRGQKRGAYQALPTDRPSPNAKPLRRRVFSFGMRFPVRGSFQALPTDRPSPNAKVSARRAPFTDLRRISRTGLQALPTDRPSPNAKVQLHRAAPLDIRRISRTGMQALPTDRPSPNVKVSLRRALFTDIRRISRTGMQALPTDRPSPNTKVSLRRPLFIDYRRRNWANQQALPTDRPSPVMQQRKQRVQLLGTRGVRVPKIAPVVVPPPTVFIPSTGLPAKARLLSYRWRRQPQLNIFGAPPPARALPSASRQQHPWWAQYQPRRRSQLPLSASLLTQPGPARRQAADLRRVRRVLTQALPSVLQVAPARRQGVIIRFRPASRQAGQAQLVPRQPSRRPAAGSRLTRPAGAPIKIIPAPPVPPRMQPRRPFNVMFQFFRRMAQLFIPGAAPAPTTTLVTVTGALYNWDTTPRTGRVIFENLAFADDRADSVLYPKTWRGIAVLGNTSIIAVNNKAQPGPPVAPGCFSIALLATDFAGGFPVYRVTYDLDGMSPVVRHYVLTGFQNPIDISQLTEVSGL